MINKPISSLDATDLAGLVSGGAEEGRHLDFKRELPGSSDKNKSELCADVSSFANTGGGYLLYGVDEEKGVASAVPGLPGIDPDASIVRIEQILSGGIDPAVPGISSRSIMTESGEVVIAVHVPQSWRAPHLVKYGSSFRMYTRSSRGKQPLDAQEIRRVFESMGSAVEHIRRWRDDRVSKILADDTPAGLRPGTKMVLHIVPLESLGDPFRIPATELDGKAIPFQPVGVTSWDHRVNLDGFVTHGGHNYQTSDNLDISYCQVFRSGRIEAVTTAAVRQIDERLVIASVQYEKMVLESTALYLKSLAKMDVSYPIAIMLSFLETRGARMGRDRRQVDHDDYPIDRDLLILPDVVLESPPDDLPRSLKPMFDAVWNSCGVSRSLNYDRQGNWTAERLAGVSTNAAR